VHNPQLLDHFANPRNPGKLEGATHEIACENPVCGDQLRLSLRCEDGRVEEVRFLARGCTASIACGSALTELLVGRRREELKQLGAADVESAVGGLIVESKHAAVLCADAVRKLEAVWK
jgi:nitrogen fixation protein NifU and related proteins